MMPVRSSHRGQAGFALLATLWLLTALSVVAGTALTLVHLERGAGLNRMALSRGRAAADGCLALAASRLGEDPAVRRVDSTDLGSGVWCRVVIEDVGAKLGVELENGEMLGALIGDSIQTASLLDWLDPDDLPRAQGAEGEWYRAHGMSRPRNCSVADLRELHRIRGFDPATVARLTPFLSTRGSRRINVNVAPATLLRTLPGLAPAAVDLILERRERSGPIPDLDAMLALLPSTLRDMASSRYGELQRATTFTPERLVLVGEGHVPEASIVARVTWVGVPLPGRLAILSREEW